MQTQVFQRKFLLNQHQKMAQLEAWSKTSQKKQVATKEKSPKKDNVISLDNSSRLELSSFFDCSDLRGAEYDPLFPRKDESVAVQNFKKGMLETVIKPKSWKDHQDRID